MWCLIILLTSLLPREGMPYDIEKFEAEQHWFSAKFYFYVFNFMVMTYLFIVTFKMQRDWPKWRIYGIRIALALAVFLAFLVEVLQWWLPINRNASLLDLASALIGVVLGWLAALIIYQKTLFQ